MDEDERKTEWNRGWAAWVHTNPAVQAFYRSRAGGMGIIERLEKGVLNFLAGDGPIGMAVGLFLGAAIMAGFTGILVGPSSADMNTASAAGKYGIEITVGVGGIGRVLVIPHSSSDPAVIPCPVWVSSDAICVEVE